VSNISRSTGRSSVAAAAYRAGAKLRCERSGITHNSSVSAAAYRSGEMLDEYDYTSKRGVVHTEILLPHNAPMEFGMRGVLWNAVEQSEKRCNSRTARDIDVALPVEFNRADQINLMRDYINESFVKHGMIADFAIHDKGDGNPHAHIMLTLRDVDRDGFGKKNREWNKKEYLQKWRANWSDLCNQRLQAKGLDERIDHRTLEEQGIDREPTIHIGVTAKAMERKGIITERVQRNRDIIARNEARTIEGMARNIHELKEGYVIVDRELSGLTMEKSQAERETRDLQRQAEKISERAGYIRDLGERVVELKAERERMGFWTSKKDIDRQISQNEQAREQAGSMFVREYDVDVGQVGVEIARLEDRARSLGNLQAKLNDKIVEFVEQREYFAIEYHRQKVLADMRPDGQRVRDRLIELESVELEKSEVHNHATNQTQRQSARDMIARNRSVRGLDRFIDQNFEMAMQDAPQEQREFLSVRHKQEREHQRERKRGRTHEISRGR